MPKYLFIRPEKEDGSGTYMQCDPKDPDAWWAAYWIDNVHGYLDGTATYLTGSPTLEEVLKEVGHHYDVKVRML